MKRFSLLSSPDALLVPPPFPPLASFLLCRAMPQRQRGPCSPSSRDAWSSDTGSSRISGNVPGGETRASVTSTVGKETARDAATASTAETKERQQQQQQKMAKTRLESYAEESLQAALRGEWTNNLILKSAQTAGLDARQRFVVSICTPRRHNRRSCTEAAQT